MVRSADVLVFLDDVQFTRRDWRNRNLILDHQNKKWITIPVENRGRDTDICNIRISDPQWWRSHISKLDAAYGNLDHYKILRPQIHSVLEQAGTYRYLTEVNHYLCNWLFNLLQINTAVKDSRQFPSTKTRSARLSEICSAVSAGKYISGPAAKSYLEVNQFDNQKVQVEWVDYSRLPQKQVGLFSDDGYSVVHDLAVFGVDETIRLTSFQPRIERQ